MICALDGQTRLAITGKHRPPPFPGSSILRTSDCEGKPKEAAAKLEVIRALEPIAPEPFLELARALGDAEGAARAEERLRRGLEGPFQESRDVWGSWLTTCLDGLDLAPSEALKRFPQASGANAAAEEVRWLLGRLEGTFTAVKKSFEVEVTDGVLDIRFHRWIENPFASAIEIERMPQG